MANKDIISDELLAAFLDGNTSKEETQQVLQALRSDKQLQEVLDVALKTDEDTTLILHNPTVSFEILPMLQKAAISGENICAVLCEIFILHRRQLPYDEEWLLNTARRKDWLKPEGTPLYCLGNLLAYSGMFVSRKYDATLEDIERALHKDNDVVVGVDLGMAIPAMCALNNDLYDKCDIGNINDFLRVRTAIAARRRRLQKSLTTTNGGHGRTKKLQALDRFAETDPDWTGVARIIPSAL